MLTIVSWIKRKEYYNVSKRLVIPIFGVTSAFESSASDVTPENHPPILISLPKENVVADRSPLPLRVFVPLQAGRAGSMH